jgi:hypothetical protein
VHPEKEIMPSGVNKPQSDQSNVDPWGLYMSKIEKKTKLIFSY